MVTLSVGPVDGLALRLESLQHMIGVILDNVVLHAAPVGRPFGRASM